MPPAAKRLPYACSLLIGIAFVAWLLPLDHIFPADPLGEAFVGDNAQSVIGQRYFLAEPWGWPLLDVRRLNWPSGISIAFTDSIPLLMLPLKLARPLLPPGFYVQDGWIALVWALQPVAAVYALRCAGERRLLPALAAAILSLCMPSLLRRLGQMSLCTHAILLIALGLYFRLVREVREVRRVRWQDGSAAIVLLWAALLVHPYLLVMASALLAAAPLSLALQRNRRWLVCAAWVGSAAGSAALLAVMLGYGGAAMLPGYGVFSMNLLGPFMPGEQGLVPFSIPDPTGGQWLEGYQYLGGGVLLLALAAAATVRQRPLSLQRHGGLLLITLLLTLFALSGVIYVGSVRISGLRQLPAIMAQFRASGRFFWPVAYTILIASVAAMARAWPRYGSALLLAAVALQLADTRRMLLADYARARGTDAWMIDVSTLAPLLARHSLLTIWPTDGCGADTVNDPAFMQLLLLGSQTLIRTNTMYAARPANLVVCDPQATLGQPWQSGELRVVTLSSRPSERHFVPDAEHACWQASGLILCEQNPPSGSAPIPPELLPTLPLSQTLSLDSAPVRAALNEGWDREEHNGVWTLGSDAVMRFHLPDGASAVRLTIAAFALPPQPGGTQDVKLLANGQPVAEWRVAGDPATTMQAALPAGTTELRLHIAQPTQLRARGKVLDNRLLGLHLASLRLDPA